MPSFYLSPGGFGIYSLIGRSELWCFWGLAHVFDKTFVSPRLNTKQGPLWEKARMR
jgi:hypothetical protein